MMNNSLQFDCLCDRIRTAYKEQDHKMGWSFLYTSQSTLHASQQLLFVGLNPGRGEDDNYQEAKSCEDGNEYLHGDWDRNKYKKGEAALQVQVQKLFMKIANSIDSTNHTCCDEFVKTLMDKSLAANYVPFRSSNWNSLQNKKNALEFSKKLWSDIFAFVQPRVIICMSLVAYDGIKAILKDKGFNVGSENPKKIGWGKATYRVIELSKEEKTIILVQLPHLSRYKVFSSTKCEIEVNDLIKKIASERLMRWCACSVANR